MAKSRLNKNLVEDTSTEVVTIRIPKNLHTDLVGIYADKLKSSKAIEPFAQTVIDTIKIGVSQLKTVA
jgi:hypothetical protein